MRYPVVLLLLVGIVGVSCRHALSPRADLRVSTSVSSAEFSVGSPIEVTATVTNHGETSREINIGTCPGPFVVTSASGAVVAPAAGPCTLELRTKALAPGESFTYAVVWRGDARSSAAGDPPRQLAAGRYFLRGIVPTSSGVVEGNAVEIRVRQ